MSFIKFHAFCIAWFFHEKFGDARNWIWIGPPQWFLFRFLRGSSFFLLSGPDSQSECSGRKKETDQVKSHLNLFVRDYLKRWHEPQRAKVDRFKTFAAEHLQQHFSGFCQLMTVQAFAFTASPTASRVPPGKDCENEIGLVFDLRKRWSTATAVVQFLYANKVGLWNSEHFRRNLGYQCQELPNTSTELSIASLGYLTVFYWFLLYFLPSLKKVVFCFTNLRKKTGGSIPWARVLRLNMLDICWVLLFLTGFSWRSGRPPPRWRHCCGKRRIAALWVKAFGKSLADWKWWKYVSMYGDSTCICSIPKRFPMASC